jgi:TIR domain-containing protein
VVKVFISWSGERSRDAAEVLHRWLRLLPGHLEPWMSAKDLVPGGRWIIQLAERLELTQAGVCVLTPENLSSPWLNYEAGAIGKAVGTSRVMTFLVGLTPAEVQAPLGQFQHTVLDETSVLKMVAELNKPTDAEDPLLSTDILAQAVNVWWPRLQQPILEIEQRAPGLPPPRRSPHDMLEEILALLRNQVSAPTVDTYPNATRVVTSSIADKAAATDSVTFDLRQAKSQAEVGPDAEQVQKFAVRAHNLLAELIHDEEEARKIEILYRPISKTAVLAYPRKLPNEVSSKLWRWAKDIGLTVRFVPADALDEQSKSSLVDPRQTPG